MGFNNAYCLHAKAFSFHIIRLISQLFLLFIERKKTIIGVYGNRIFFLK